MEITYALTLDAVRQNRFVWNADPAYRLGSVEGICGVRNVVPPIRGKNTRGKDGPVPRMSLQ